MHKEFEHPSTELNGLIKEMLQQENQHSMKQLFLEFPILQNAILELLNMFVPVNNFTFEKLMM
jgi:hypothetical protein